MSKFSYQRDTGPGIYHGLEELCVGFLDQAALQIRTFDEELLQENSAKLNQCRRGPAGKQRMFRGFSIPVDRLVTSLHSAGCGRFC